VRSDLTQAELLALEYDLCRRNPLYWIKHYGYIRDERTGAEFGPGLSLWSGTDGAAGQFDFAAHYSNGDDIELLKARQLGASWLAENLDVWELMFNPRVRLAIIDKNEQDAFDHIARMRLIYEKQPPYLVRDREPLLGKDSKGEFGLGNRSDYSLIRSYPCTAGTTRGPAVKRVRLEEYAYYQNADAVLAAVHAATADSGGQVVGISTANGEGTPHHKRWLEASAGRSGAMPVFWPWHLHPDRDEAWYERTRAKYPSLALFMQEFPATPEEAFIASGAAYFNRDDIENSYEPMPPIEQPWPGVSIYADYQRGGTFYITGDTADGGGDACSASVRRVCPDTGKIEQVAHLHSYDWDAGGFADHIAVIGKRYGYPLVVLEREGYGMKVYERLRSAWSYPSLYVHDDGKDGHPTTSTTRPWMLADLSQVMRDLGWLIHSEQSYRELRAFAWIKNKPQAPEGQHDDCVMDEAVAARVIPRLVAASNYTPPEPVGVNLYD